MAEWLDCFLSDRRWWRQWRGGIWFKVFSRLDVFYGHYWTRDPPRFSLCQDVVGFWDYATLRPTIGK